MNQNKDIEDKAKAIYDKFHYQICNDCGLSESDSTSFAAKMCSFIHVDGIIEALDYPLSNFPDAIKVNNKLIGGKEYWQSIKSAIQNL